MRRTARDGLLTQAAHIDPGAADQLEILSDAPVELQALFGLIRLMEDGGVAAAEKAFVVKAFVREFGLAPIAGRDVGAAIADLELVCAADWLASLVLM